MAARLAALALNNRPLAHTWTGAAAGRSRRDHREERPRVLLRQTLPFFHASARLGSGTVHLVFPGSFGATNVFLLIRQKTEQHARSCSEDGLMSPAENERPRFCFFGGVFRFFCFVFHFSLKKIGHGFIYFSNLKRTESDDFPASALF